MPGFRGQVASTEDPPAEAAKPKATVHPAGLDTPSIDLEELQLRLIPLTADQLGALAAVWQEQACSGAQAAVDKSLAILYVPPKIPKRGRCVRSDWRC